MYPKMPDLTSIFEKLESTNRSGEEKTFRKQVISSANTVNRNRCVR